MLPRSLDADIKTYSHRRSSKSLFQPIAFSAPASHVTCILGASGTGKTTLLRILLGAVPGSLSGSVLYRFTDANDLEPRAAATAGAIGALFHGNSLVPWKTVKANLILPCRLNPDLERPSAQAIFSVLASLGLDSSILELYPFQLSLGMKQRVQYARLLLFVPRFLLLDEPFLGLDPINIDRIAASIQTYVTTHAACCVMVTHDITIAQRIANSWFYLSSRGTLTRLPGTALEHDLLAAFREDDSSRLSPS